MSNNKFSISFGVKGFFPFPFSIVMQIYAHLFCLSLSNCRLTLIPQHFSLTLFIIS